MREEATVREIISTNIWGMKNRWSGNQHIRIQEVKVYTHVRGDQKKKLVTSLNKTPEAQPLKSISSTKPGTRWGEQKWLKIYTHTVSGDLKTFPPRFPFLPCAVRQFILSLCYVRIGMLFSSGETESVQFLMWKEQTQGKGMIQCADKQGIMYKFIYWTIWLSELPPHQVKTGGFLFSVTKQFHILMFGWLSMK